MKWLLVSITSILIGLILYSWYLSIQSETQEANMRRRALERQQYAEQQLSLQLENTCYPYKVLNKFYAQGKLYAVCASKDSGFNILEAQ